MDIYWIADKKKCGPATVPDVLSLVQMGELTPDTKGWHAGCDQWMPLRELPALADFLQQKKQEEAEVETLPPVPDAPEMENPVPAVEAEPSPDTPLPPGTVRVFLSSPASRLLARLVDMALYMTLVFGVVYAREIPFTTALLPSAPVVWIGFILLEACLVSYLGTTPGKALLGIQVRSVNGTPMSFGRSCARACWVFVGGMGMMVSLLPLFMMAYSWWTLRSRGITMWDARCSTLPLQFVRTSVVRQFMAVVVLMACLHVSSYCLQPWILPMVEAVEQQSPETGQWMRQLMPENTPPAQK